MDAFAYTLLMTLVVATLFFAVAFRDPPKSAKTVANKPPSLFKAPLRRGFFFLFKYFFLQSRGSK